MAVPAEERVSTRDCAVLHLGKPARAAKRGERDAAEQSGAERLHWQAQVRLVLRAFGSAALELPATFVPGTELVGDLEHDRFFSLVGTSGERGPDIDETHPESVTHAIARASRCREQHEERMIRWQERRLGRRDPVDREQVRPDVAERFRRRAEGLENPELCICRPGLEARLVPVCRVPLETAVALVYDP